MKVNIMKVTAILPTYNNEKTIEKCLKSILNQSYKDLDIIVVDDGSTDNTVKILRRFKSIKIIEKEHTHRPKNLNIGIKKAKGEIIFIVETDGYYEKNYLKKCLKYFKDKNIAGTIGKLYCTRPNENFWRRVRDLEFKVRFKDYKPFTAWIYKKKILEEVGGYDEDLYVHDDFILGRKMKQKGYRFAWVPEAKWWHEEKVGLKDMYRQRMKWGIGFVPLFLKYKYVPKFIPLFTFLLFVLLFSIKYPLILIIYPIFYLLFILKYSLKATKITKNPIYLFLIPLLKIYRGLISSIGFWYGMVLKLFRKNLLKYT